MEHQIVYIVETVKNNKFIFVGTVTIDYQWVLDAIDATQDISHNMPSKFARREARKKYPDVNPPIVKPIEEWEEKYGDSNQYKRGDIVK